MLVLNGKHFLCFWNRGALCGGSFYFQKDSKYLCFRVGRSAVFELLGDDLAAGRCQDGF